MINSLVGSLMNMKCDIYIQQNDQGTSGVIKRAWVYHSTINCRIDSVRSGKVAGQTDNKEFDSGNNSAYKENLELKLKSAIPLSKRYRISGIKTSDGESPYVELDKYNYPDTVFEIVSSHTQIDPLGKIHYYQSNIKRVQVQDNDIYNPA